MTNRSARYSPLAAVMFVAGCYLTTNDVLEENQRLRDENMRLQGRVEAYREANRGWSDMHQATVAAIGSRLEAINERERNSFGAQAERFFERFMRGEQKPQEERRDF